MDNGELVPALRFPEFEGDWQKSTLKKSYSIVTGSTPPTSDKSNYGEDYLFVSPADLGKEKFVTNTKTMLSKKGFDKSRSVEKGAIFFVCIGSTIGKVGQAHKKSCTNQQINSLQAKNNHFNDFGYYLLEKNGPKIKLLAGVQAVPQLNKTDFSNLKFYFPNLKEQQKIASFLTAIDQRITKLKEKKAALEDYKKGLMQKIFSQEIRFKPDSNAPLLRGDTGVCSDAPETSLKTKNHDNPYEHPPTPLSRGEEVSGDFPDWEEVKLKDVLDYEQPTKYLVDSTEYDDQYDLPVLTAGKTFILGYTNETNDIFEENLPTIIFDDFTTAFKYVDFPFKAKSSAMKMLVPKHEAISMIFVYEAMKQIRFPLAEHKRYWISEYQNEKIKWPCFEEQQKIANFLTAIDQKINAMDKQIADSELFKKGLLQRMFV